MKGVVQFGFFLVVSLMLLGTNSVFAASSAAADSQKFSDEDQQVIQSFTSKKHVESETVAIPDAKKKLIMFFLGVPLLLLIIATVSLGIAMGVYGKPVYVAHMVCAGLSLTLALAHAVVGLVWFYPF